MESSALLDRIGRQIENYRDLLSISEEQDRAAAGGALPGDLLLAFAMQKSAVMNRIDELDRELAPVRDGWSESRLAFAPDEGREIESRFGELKRALERVLEVEEKNQSALVGRMEEIQGSIARTGRANLIQKAYGRSGPGENRFVDKSQ